MRKREISGRFKTLAHNVMNNFDAHLALDNAFAEQLKKLGLEDYFVDRKIIWKIDVEINGVKYIGGVKSCTWKK